ncbi:MAG: LytTR family DNA-binding domain-containing protein [Bacteroidota bacterium]|nr:LytTR family DNA-binding domain-containing protein [Bacteroidota bacterium]
MRIAIVEDEKLAADKLERMILQARPGANVVLRCQSVSEARSQLFRHELDLIFLDIQLGDGLSFSIFEGNDPLTPVIFTTAFDEYTLRAFRLNSIDYLLKPIRMGDLDEALRKFDALNLRSVDMEQLAKTFHQPEPQRRFLVKEGQAMRTIFAEEVAYFFADGKYAYIVDRSGKQFLADQPLYRLSENVDPTHFFQVNRKFLVNIHSIRQMVPWSKSRLLLKLEPDPGEEVVVSAERATPFREWVSR